MADVSRQWIWDQIRKSYYYWSPESNCYVYQDGQLIGQDGLPLSAAVPGQSQFDQTPRTPGEVPEFTTSPALELSPTSSASNYLHTRSSGASSQGLQQPYQPQPDYNVKKFRHPKTNKRVPLERYYQRAETYGAEPITEESAVQLGIHASRKLASTQGSKELLDPRFRKRYPGKDFFKIGKIFKVLWPELAGDRNDNITIASVVYGADVALKIRWFIVVKEGDNCCSCLPIQTYGRQGVAKPSVTKAHHAIIHTGNNPGPTKREMSRPGDMLQSIRARHKSPSDRLDNLSRVNFAKIYTVEHNVKVYDFGAIDKDYLPRFLENFRTVWNIVITPGPTPAQASGPFPPPANEGIDDDDDENVDEEDEDDGEEGDNDDDDDDDDEEAQPHLEPVLEPELEVRGKGKARLYK